MSILTPSISFGKVWAVIITIISISTAHYAGYIKDLPPQLSIAGGSTLAAGVTTTFIFIATVAVVLSRIIAIFTYAMILVASDLLFSLELWAKRAKKMKYKRLSIRRHQCLIKRESILSFFIQVPAFLLLMFNFYVKGSSYMPSLIWLFVFIILMLGLINRLGLSIFNLRRIYKKIGNKSHIEFQGSTLVHVFLVILGSLTIVSYLAGEARIKHVLNLDAVTIETGYYNGKAQLLISTGEVYLLREAQLDKNQFILLSPESIIRIDEGDAGNKLFP